MKQLLMAALLACFTFSVSANAAQINDNKEQQTATCAQTQKCGKDCKCKDCPKGCKDCKCTTAEKKECKCAKKACKKDCKKQCAKKCNKQCKKTAKK